MWTGPPVPVSWRSLRGDVGGFAVKEMIFFYPSPLPSSARPPLAALLPEEVRREGVLLPEEVRREERFVDPQCFAQF